ncbi:MAG TPA: leucine--tRNA ligase [Thermoanaerobaculia bacterium]|nr:leucine--tRNA ligase [Thermoanaerobaculia bacterium]
MTDSDRIPPYDPSEIESRWQRQWEADGLYRSDVDESATKYYALTMLPYPSGDLHMGHWYAITPSDARARFKRMQGHNVMFPMGFDAFGLPAENAAIKNNIHPRKWTYANIERMRGQLRTMGTMIDWRREMVSADPEYFRWNQWFFLQFLAADLAYRKKAAVDWCPSCNTTLAREQVIGEDRRCERCDTPVIKKELAQWFFRTTRYAEELLDFSGIDWPERVRTLQTHWIGRSEGARVRFPLAGVDAGADAGGVQELEVFTTRPDTLWGATFMVVAPEHPAVEVLTSEAQRAAVEAYVEKATRRTDVERESADREKTGVDTGGFAVNPATGERIPVWVADYVLMSYGTGAIMAVPAHDQRDFEFARKYDLEIRPVVANDDGSIPDPATMEEAVPARGALVDSGDLTGTPADQAVAKACEWLEAKGAGVGAVNYRLHDWLISRQRYWGTPIPIVHCPTCGPVGVPESELPVELPDDVEWKPTGESPLKLHESWRFTECPKCGEPAERDTDTMDTFMDSSWYHLRYLSPDYHEGPFDPAEYRYWMPVDLYTGGIEHATMHLIYTRFFHKACRDLGITQGDEPMRRLRNQGIILGEDSEKMSKSRGNVVAPDALVAEYGADCMRAYLMFFARWEQGGPWSSTGIEGTVRWLRRVWALMLEPEALYPEVAESADASTLRALRRKLHQTIEHVTRDFEELSFNTIVSALMELANEMSTAVQAGAVGSEEWSEAASVYLRLLAPVAPHVAEELWQRRGHDDSVHRASWPEYDAAAAAEDEITLVVQVNGKVRDRLTLPADVSEEEAKEKALASEGGQKFTEGLTVRKVIYVPGRLVNVVAS